MTQLVLRLAHSRSAAAAAEFALLVPIMLTLMFGTFQVGLLMFAYNQMETAARDTARSMAVCTITDTTAAGAQALAELPAWIPAGSWTITPTIGSPDVNMTISVPTATAMIINFVPIALGQLTTTVTMVKEPLAFGGGTC